MIEFMKTDDLLISVNPDFVVTVSDGHGDGDTKITMLGGFSFHVKDDYQTVKKAMLNRQNPTRKTFSQWGSINV